MNGLIDSQVSGNDWTPTPAEMLSQMLEVPEPAHRVKSRVGRQVVERIQEQLEAQMAQFEAAHEAVVIALQRDYVFLDERLIRRFFRSRRTIPQVLSDAIPHLRQSFGAGAVINLRVAIDEYGAQTLYAVVIWPGDVQDVRAAIDAFDEGWWIANSRRALGDLGFTYELV